MSHCFSIHISCVSDELSHFIHSKVHTADFSGSSIFVVNTFVAALSITLVAFNNSALASSLSFAATAASTFLTAVLTADLIILFLKGLCLIYNDSFLLQI